MIGLSLFLTLFIMAPIANRINTEAFQPYSAKQIAFNEAANRASVPLRQFMLRQTRPGEVEFFLGLAGEGPTAVDDLPLRVVIPAFIVSELRTAFQMGFLVFIPFMVIDFLVASTLMAMGHDDDAADRGLAAFQAAAVRTGGRLASWSSKSLVQSFGI